MSEEGSGTSAIFDAETGTLALEAFIASLKAVLQAFVVAAAGMWMTRRGILKPEVIGAFSKLSMKVTLPCKLFTSMLQHAKPEVIASSWPILLLPPVYVFVGCTIGFILAKTLRAPRNFFNATIAAVGFPNSTGMPLVLLAVAEKNVTPGHGSIGFLSMYLLIYPLLQWLIAYRLLQPVPLEPKRSAKSLALEMKKAASFAKDHANLHSGVTPLAGAERTVTPAGAARAPAKQASTAKATTPREGDASTWRPRGQGGAPFGRPIHAPGAAPAAAPAAAPTADAATWGAFLPGVTGPAAAPEASAGTERLTGGAGHPVEVLAETSMRSTPNPPPGPPPGSSAGSSVAERSVSWGAEASLAAAPGTSNLDSIHLRNTPSHCNVHPPAGFPPAAGTLPAGYPPALPAAASSLSRVEAADEAARSTASKSSVVAISPDDVSIERGRSSCEVDRFSVGALGAAEPSIVDVPSEAITVTPPAAAEEASEVSSAPKLGTRDSVTRFLFGERLTSSPTQARPTPTRGLSAIGDRATASSSCVETSTSRITLSKMKQVSGRLKGVALWKKAGEKVVRDNRVARVKKGFLTAVVGEYDDSLLALAMGEGFGGNDFTVDVFGRYSVGRPDKQRDNNRRVRLWQGAAGRVNAAVAMGGLKTTPEELENLTEMEVAIEGMNNDSDNAWARMRAAKAQGFDFCGKFLAFLQQRVFMPPVVGTLLGLFCALVPPFYFALCQDVYGPYQYPPLPNSSSVTITTDGMEVTYNDCPHPNAPFSWVAKGVEMLGDAAVPVNLLLLGASLCKGPVWSAVPKRLAFGIVFGRMVLMPLFGVGVAYIMYTYLSPPLQGEWAPQFFLASMVVTCTPTANNLMVMVHLSGGNRAGMSTAIFTQYCFAPILLTLSITAFTVMIKSFEGKILECDPDLQVCDYDER